jgi:Cu-Zn family superoxide dismutase
MLLSGAICLIGPALATAQPRDTTVQIQSRGGEPVGTATLTTEGSNGIRFHLDLRGLPPGEHALHIHERPVCEPPSFESAGPHFNPDDRRHGLNSPEGPHGGDMPNIVVAADGTARATLVNPRVTLDDGPRSVFSGAGTALIVHAGRDDLTTDPSGNAGDRIACGRISR